MFNNLDKLPSHMFFFGPSTPREKCHLTEDTSSALVAGCRDDNPPTPPIVPQAFFFSVFLKHHQLFVDEMIYTINE